MRTYLSLETVSMCVFFQGVFVWPCDCLPLRVCACMCIAVFECHWWIRQKAWSVGESVNSALEGREAALSSCSHTLSSPLSLPSCILSSNSTGQGHPVDTARRDKHTLSGAGNKQAAPNKCCIASSLICYINHLNNTQREEKRVR